MIVVLCKEDRIQEMDDGLAHIYRSKCHFNTQGFKLQASAVPSQLVLPSSTQAFHDADSRVAVRISWMTSSLKGSDRMPAGAPPEEFPEVVPVTVFGSIIPPS